MNSELEGWGGLQQGNEPVLHKLSVFFLPSFFLAATQGRRRAGEGFGQQNLHKIQSAYKLLGSSRSGGCDCFSLLQHKQFRNSLPPLKPALKFICTWIHWLKMLRSAQCDFSPKFARFSLYPLLLHGDNKAECWMWARFVGSRRGITVVCGKRQRGRHRNVAFS